MRTQGQRPRRMRQGMHMKGLVLTVIAITGSLLWLGLLMATRFNPVAVSVGLLVALLVSGSSVTSEAPPMRRALR